MRRCRALYVHRAAAAPSSECIFHRHYVCPSVPIQNERRAGGVGEAPNLPFRLVVIISLSSHMTLKRVRAEVMVRVRVRLVIGLNLWFGLGLVWNSTVY